jgi:O-antigen biosynthesis protein
VKRGLSGNLALIPNRWSMLVELESLDLSGKYVRLFIRNYLTTTPSWRVVRLRRLLEPGSFRYRVLLKLLVLGLKIQVKVRHRFFDKPPAQSEELEQLLSSAGPLSFSATAQPVVTIVIPVYNNWHHTENCLRSLSRQAFSIPVQVMVVDDGSSDETPARLKEITGITVVTQPKNAGYMYAVRAGVEEAQSEFILLLNNDVVVCDNWLEPLLARMEDPKIGAVGSMLLFPNGTLQEAGALLFSDATGANFGKGDDPRRPWYQTPHQVDYCSGASLLVRKKAWDAVGGFDVSYAPAYYEETDFCFALRDHGYAVWFEPASRLFHIEGASYGTELSPERQELFEKNRHYFASKWQSELATHWPSSYDNQVGASWASPLGRVLIVDQKIPQPDQDSGSIRMMGIIEILVKMGFGVTVLALRLAPVEPYLSDLRRMGVEVLDGRINYTHEIARLAPYVKFALLSRPDETALTYELMREFAPHVPIIYDTVDLHFVRESRRATIEQSEEVARIASTYRQLELGLVEKCDATFVVTPSEKTMLDELVPNRSIAVVSNVHGDLPPGPGFAARKNLLFVGNYEHLPNVDAVEWFVKEILPVVRQSLPDVSLSVVGANLPERLAAFAGEGVDIVGWAKDLRPFYDQTRVVVAPLRFGAGIKGKMGEAAVHGVPVVASPMAIEGTYFVPGQDLLSTDNAEQFAADVIALYQDQAMWERFSQNARSAVLRQCAPEVVTKEITDTLHRVGVSTVR